MARRTKEEAERTRDAILDAAEERFHERGVARTSLEEVARAAGVTRGAVYWHFRDKVALFEAMQARARLPQADVLEWLLDTDHEDSVARLCDTLNDVIAVMATDLRRRRVFTILHHRCEFVEDMRAIAQRKQDHIDQMIERAARFFERAAQRGELSPLWTPATAALAMHALMMGLLDRMLQSDTPEAAVAPAQACVTAFFRSLQKRPLGSLAPRHAPPPDPAPGVG
ncbi:TetR family transcriptional regulator [Azospirillum sp. ST 5-10]|uniref:TetR family transcriptional regulator n=1 Tax=unclassified Azospirillum TaxID=2630922 RepID=UPI003F49F467